MKEFRTLRADEIECRVATVKESGLSLLLYKNARTDMQLLDETVGPMNWQREHKEMKGNIYCGISIWDEEKKQWITKWDCGKESNTESEKGEASDSFKRAGFCWNIGRELYTAPFIWIDKKYADIKVDNNKKCKCFDIFAVEQILYEGKTIVALSIINKTKKCRVFLYDIRKKAS